MPVRDVGKGVHANQEEKFVIGFEALLEPPNGADRVVRFFRRRFPAWRSFLLGSFQQRGNEWLLFRRGQGHHGIAMDESCKWLLLLVRGDVGGDEINAIEFILGQRYSRQRQVPAVNGIEGS